MKGREIKERTEKSYFPIPIPIQSFRTPPHLRPTRRPHNNARFPASGVKSLAASLADEQAPGYLSQKLISPTTVAMVWVGVET